MFRCSRTERVYADFNDGIYDDDEWISWDWINGQIASQELARQYPNADPELVALFEELVSLARDYRDHTGRYLQIWGELGEVYAETHFGIKLHRAKAPGSDGRLGNDFVEVKTISPEKSSLKVEVKRAGNFSKLLIVRISEDFEFEAAMINRSTLSKGNGKVARVSWPRKSDGACSD